jgi:hypothetical protein
MMKKRTFAAVVAVPALFVGLGAGVAVAASGAPAAVPLPKPGNYVIYACDAGSSRALVHAYTTPQGFQNSGGCPKGSFAVAFNSTGPAGARGPQGPAGPQGPGAPAYLTEVDNGTEYALSGSPHLADTSKAGATYSDAGVVVDVGQTSALTELDISFAGTISSGTLDENIWVENGPQATTPGVYSLTGGADFCYGLGADYSGGVPTSFEMQADCGAFAGQTLSLSQVAADFPNLEAAVWVGVVSSGGAVTADIDSVDFKSINVSAGVMASSSGVLTPFVRP